MEFIMVMGLDGSGRSEYAQSLKDTVVHTEAEALRLIHDGQSCVLDAPNLSEKQRKAFLQRIREVSCKKRIVLTARNAEICMNLLPERAEDIRRQYLSFHPPQKNEGWDEITLLYADDAQFISLDDLFFGKNGLVFLSQDNPFHRHSVGMHCIRAARIAASLRPDDVTLWLASLLHDIGKAKTKAFIDSKGNPSPTAHYYKHEYASSYDSLFVRFPKAVEEQHRLRVSALIAGHMKPHHFIANEKTRARYERLWGKEFVEDMFIIERADREAQL